MHTSVLTVLLLAATTTGGGSTGANMVEYSWLELPSGVALRRISEESSAADGRTRGGIGLTYLTTAGAVPFDSNVVRAIREYLVAKSPDVHAVLLGAWVLDSSGRRVRGMRYRNFVRRADGTWDRDKDSRDLVASVQDRALVVVPLERDLRTQAAARGAMTAWLDAFAREDFDSCWAVTSEEFRSGFSREEWRGTALSLTRRLGPLATRRELARSYGRIPGTDQVYATIEYRSSYAYGGFALETISAKPCTRAPWCITGWDVKP